MRKSSLLIFSGCLFLLFSLQAFSVTKGYLFIIGGGSRPPGMMEKFVQLAQWYGNVKIVVFPMASAEPDKTGASQVAELRKAGAKKAVYYNLTRPQALKEKSAEILDDAGGVFFSGGVQSRLTKILLDTPVHKKLLQIYEKGCVIGGTSAGAAVLSEIMITGDENKKVEEGHEFETIEARNIVTAPGLGFIKNAIVDQHFATRKRHNRLISLVAEHPQLLGLGIDESTAIIISPNEIFEVIGQKNVIVYDGSGAKIKILPSQAIGLTKMTIHVLLPGERFDLKRRKVID